MIENFYFGTLVCLSLNKKWTEKKAIWKQQRIFNLRLHGGLPGRSIIHYLYFMEIGNFSNFWVTKTTR